MQPHKSDEPRSKDAHNSLGVARFLPPATIITIVLAVAGVWVLIRLLPAVLVLITALFIVGALSPVVQWLEKRRLRRGLSISIVFMALLVITLLIVTLTIPELLAQVTSLIDQEPVLRARLVARLGACRTFDVCEILTS
jgi:predicted PurR-regulated permease PerM